jgi:hypothetical protein
MGCRAFEFCDPLQGGPKHLQAVKEKPDMITDTCA